MFYDECQRRWHTKTQNSLDRVLQNLERADISPSSVLAFWSQVVHLPVDRVQPRTEPRGVEARPGQGYGYTVRGPAGQNLCYLPVTEEYRQAQPDKMHFLLIAQHRRWELQLGPIFQLLHVKKQGEISYRVQIVRDSMITTNIWPTLNPEWEFIVMA